MYKLLLALRSQISRRNNRRRVEKEILTNTQKFHRFHTGKGTIDGKNHEIENKIKWGGITS
ncbi:MAG: hypothetical protein LBF88_04750 [Planctomycetaceae bacterium]|nr:hypothetical protein [Planctomycetaceae bacterium]